MAAATDEASPRVFASLPARFAAGLIDLGVITLASLVLNRALADQGRAVDLAITVLTSVYFIFSYSAGGGGYSVGKFLMGIRVVSAQGESLPAFGAIMRWFLSIGIALPLALLIIGFERGTPVQTGPAFAVCVPILCVMVIDSYMAIADRVSHRSLHDLAAGSYVVRREHTGPVPETEPLHRKHYKVMAAICVFLAIMFARSYPWARVIGQRSVELMKARAVAIATGKAKKLIIAPGFSAQGTDTIWVVTGFASIGAKPQSEGDAEKLRKGLACSLARSAPMSFHGAELDLNISFDPGSKAGRGPAIYFADLELTPEACNGK